MFGEHVVIQLYKAKKSDLQLQLTNNSEQLCLKHKQNSNALTNIHKSYSQEQSMIRNQIESLDDKTGSEYKELLTELEELKDEEDRAANFQEKESAAYEEQIQTENTTLETQIQAMTADIEGLEKMREESIKNNFSYFQNN